MTSRPRPDSTVVILASLDTKAYEAAYLRSRIEAKGFDVVMVDVGYGRSTSAPTDVSADEVAAATGTDIATIRSKVDTGEAAQLMVSGATVIVQRLLAQDRCDGVIAFGGVSNATLATGVMQTLPVGMPKVVVSSAAAMPAYAARFFGARDITMINALVDFAGLNDLSRTFLDAGAGAVCGMVDSVGPVASAPGSRQVAVTGFRFSEQCTQAVVARLEGLGYTAVPMHAQGVGENAFEDLIRQGAFVGVVDVVPAGLAEHLFGGNRAARADRLEAAGAMGIPQVISTSGFDMISCGPLSRRDSGDPLWEARRLAERPFHVPDRFRVQVRTTADEVAEVGRAVAAKLNRATGPSRVMVPTRGWSSLSVAGTELHDPEADAAFVPALTSELDARIAVEEIDVELNSERFAHALADALNTMIEETVELAP